MSKLIELHALEIIDNNTLRRRVDGGWIYSDMHGMAFVPDSSETARTASDSFSCHGCAGTHEKDCPVSRGGK
jgi:hypothetical protein